MALLFQTLFILSVSFFKNVFDQLFRIFKNFVYLFLFLTGSSFLHGLVSSCREQGLLSSCDARAFHSGSVSCHGAWGSRHTGSVVAGPGL